MLFEAPCNIKNMILFGWPLECLCMCIFYCHNRSSINVPWTGKLNGRAVFLFQQLIWSGWGPMDNTCFTFGPQKMFRDSVHTWIRTNKIRFYTFPCKFFRQRSVFGVKMLYILTKRVFFPLITSFTCRIWPLSHHTSHWHHPCKSHECSVCQQVVQTWCPVEVRVWSESGAPPAAVWWDSSQLTTETWALLLWLWAPAENI